MKPSDRIENITNGGSDGWEIFYKARKMMASGINVIELSIGEHDIGTSRSVALAADVLHRSRAEGLPGLGSMHSKGAAKCDHLPRGLSAGRPDGGRTHIKLDHVTHRDEE